MSVAFRQFDLDEYRKSVQAMSEEQLLKEGKTMRRLSGDGKIVTTTPSAFDEQLRICREEYRRRHPKRSANG